MTDERYAPPGAKLADTEPAGDVTRPRIVTRAIQLLWASFAIDVVASIWSAFKPQEDISVALNIGVSVFMLLIQFGIAYWLLSAAGRGGGWSRWVQAALFAAGMVSMYWMQAMMPQAFVFPWYIDLLYGVDTLLTLFGLGFLFAPSANAWYRAMKAERTRVV